RANGLRRAQEFSRARWREEFGRLINMVLDAPGRPRRSEKAARPSPRQTRKRYSAASRNTTKSTASTLLSKARTLEKLPDSYVDVTEGRFARLKRWLKAKLLRNFQHSYVNVLSRQQTAFNKRLADAVAALAEENADLRRTISSLRSSALENKYTITDED